MLPTRLLLRSRRATLPHHEVAATPATASTATTIPAISGHDVESGRADRLAVTLVGKGERRRRVVLDDAALSSSTSAFQGPAGNATLSGTARRPRRPQRARWWRPHCRWGRRTVPRGRPKGSGSRQDRRSSARVGDRGDDGREPVGRATWRQAGDREVGGRTVARPHRQVDRTPTRDSLVMPFDAGALWDAQITAYCSTSGASCGTAIVTATSACSRRRGRPWAGRRRSMTRVRSSRPDPPARMSRPRLVRHRRRRRSARARRCRWTSSHVGWTVVPGGRCRRCSAVPRIVLQRDRRVEQAHADRSVGSGLIGAARADAGTLTAAMTATRKREEGTHGSLSGRTAETQEASRPMGTEL